MRKAIPAAQQQVAQALDPQIEAMQQTIIELTGQSLNYRTQAIALKAQVDELTKQLADAKKAPATPETPKP